MATNQSPISIIGIGDDGLDAASDSVKKLVHEAETLVGNERVLALVGEGSQQRITMSADIEETVERIESADKGPIAVLVSGDPLFYGLARFLCDRLGRDRCEIIPHVSSMQLAFARVKESWDEAYLTNLANHDLESIVDRIGAAEKVGLFTTPECGPAAIAEALLAHRIDYFTVYVCENLGAKNECVTRGSLKEIASQDFGPLNVMILVRDAETPDRPRVSAVRSLFGNPDDMFVQSKPKHGLLTTSEVRAIALAKLSLGSRSIVWDVGAGCGSVSVEAAQLAVGGQVYAIEQDAEDADLIRENAKRFEVTNVTPVVGRAPDCWADLPDPTAVFLEGSGREIAKLSELAFERLQKHGHLVANVVSVDGLLEMRAALAEKATRYDVLMVNVARAGEQLERLRFDSLRPAFLIAAQK